jgi:hypothetical protein
VVVHIDPRFSTLLHLAPRCEKRFRILAATRLEPAQHEKLVMLVVLCCHIVERTHNELSELRYAPKKYALARGAARKTVERSR